MDIEKCYPNILSLESAQIIRKMWEESNLEMEGVKIDNLCRYLGNFPKPEVIKEGYEDIFYTKKIKRKKASRKQAGMIIKTVKH